MYLRISLALALGWALPLAAQQPTAEIIMARVAANQDRSEAERSHYVYVQHAHVITRKGKTIRCEETTDFRIIPTDRGSSKQLLKLDGRLLHKGKYIQYSELPTPAPNASKDMEADSEDMHAAAKSEDDDDMDRDLAENMRENLTHTKSKDGIGAGLFPLTSKIQADYQYHLEGKELRNGRDCFHITFSPRDKDDYGWKGDAWIDAKAFQPVVVRTTMARNIPFATRTLLGTSVPGLGFTVTYAPEPADTPDALWFPVTFGTEFRLHLLFFLNRQIVLDAQNRDFEKTHVTSKVLSEPASDSTKP